MKQGLWPNPIHLSLSHLSLSGPWHSYATRQSHHYINLSLSLSLTHTKVMKPSLLRPRSLTCILSPDIHPSIHIHPFCNTTFLLPVLLSISLSMLLALQAFSLFEESHEFNWVTKSDGQQFHHVNCKIFVINLFLSTTIHQLIHSGTFFLFFKRKPPVIYSPFWSLSSGIAAAGFCVECPCLYIDGLLGKLRGPHASPFVRSNSTLSWCA